MCGVFLLASVVSRARAPLEVSISRLPISRFSAPRPGSSSVIGHYTVKQTANTLILHGENHYLNGEYDIEEDQLSIIEGRSLPVLVNFRHNFFQSPMERRR